MTSEVMDLNQTIELLKKMNESCERIAGIESVERPSPDDSPEERQRKFIKYLEVEHRVLSKHKNFGPIA